MFKYSFEKLESWQLARELTVKMYHLLKSFPPEEKFGIVSQMRRSAVSVCSNLAEGSSRNSNKNKKYFYNMAYGSLMELLNQVIISNDMGWITSEQMPDLRRDFEKISNKINALRKSIPEND